VILLYDGDEPGQKAMFRATELLLRQGAQVRAAVLPAQHDPDTYIEAEGVQGMRDILTQAPNAVDYFIEKTAQTCPITRPEGKADAVGRLAPLLLAMEDPALREGYLGRAASRLGLRVETLEASLKRRTLRRLAPRADEPNQEDGPVPIVDEPSRSEQNLLFIVLQKGGQWELLQSIDPNWFQNEVARSLFEKFYDAQRDVREGGDPPEEPFALCETDEERQWLSRILLLPAQRFGGEVASYDETMGEALNLQVVKLRKRWIQQRKHELRQDLTMILAESPLGTGQLEAIDRLSRENVASHERLLDRQGEAGRPEGDG
jgi:DNA primase